MTGQPQAVTDLIQFAFPKLVDDSADKLRQAYLNNVAIMVQKQQQLPDFKTMWNYLKFGTLPNKSHGKQTVLVDHQNFVIGDDGLLYHLFSPAQCKNEHSYRAQFCLSEEYRDYVVHKYHDDVLGTHCGAVRLLTALRKHHFWPKMQADVTNYVHTCEMCVQSK